MRAYSIRFVLAIVCFACFQTLTQAQYSFDKIEGPKGGFFQNIKMTTDGYLFSLDYLGSLFRGNPDGTWSNLQSPDSLLSYSIIGNRIITLDWGNIMVSMDQGQTFSKKYTIDRNTIYDRFERILQFPDNTLGAYFFKKGSSGLTTQFLISHDLGESWSPGSSVSYLGGLITDKNGNVFSKWTGVYRSTDRLNSFQKVSNGNLYSLANKGSKLYAIFGDSLNLYTSDDTGMTWEKTNLDLSGCGPTYPQSYLYQIDDDVYLVNGGRVFKLSENPLSLQLVTELPVGDGISITDLKKLNNQLYISTTENLYRGNLNWTNWEEIIKHEVNHVYKDMLIDGNQVFVSTYGRVYKSLLEQLSWSVSLSKECCNWGYPNRITKIGNDSIVVFSDDLVYTSVDDGNLWTHVGTTIRSNKTELISGEFYTNASGTTKHILKLNTSTQTWEYFNKPWNESWDITTQFYIPTGYKQIIGKSTEELFMSGRESSGSYKIYGWNPITDQLREIGSMSGLTPVQATMINGEFYALGSNFSYQPGYTYKLLKLSNGNNWEAVVQGESYLGEPKLRVQGNFIFILNLYSQLTLSNDNGFTWQTYSFPNMPTGASVDSEGNVYVAVSKSGIYKSSSRYNAFSLEIKTPEIKWLDANNDGILDISGTAENNGQVNYLLLQGTGVDKLKNIQSIPAGYISAKSALTDFNHDNKIDIVISGTLLSGATSTDVFLNKGDFVFEKSIAPISDKAFKSFLLSDLNSDGARDLIGADESTLSVFEKNKNGFSLKKDSTLKVVSLQSFDFDKNGFNDIVFSGFDLNDQPITMVWLFKADFLIMKRMKVADIAGTLDVGDTDHDGYFDLAIAGKNASSELQTAVFKNKKTSFDVALDVTGLDSTSIKIADFTSDGMTDIALFGKTSTGEKVNWIRTFSGDSIALPNSNLRAQDFGDNDQDGDLDWAQIIGNSLKVFSNTLGNENQGPGVPGNATAFQLYERMFFYWAKPADDFTPEASITYDLRVFDQDSTIIAADFDNVNRHRLLVAHGNMGTANYSLQKIQGNYTFEVQAIDNSFTPQVTAVCSGVCSACTSMDEQNIVVCSDTPVILTAPAPEAMWFSFSEGFLGTGSTFSIEEVKEDTVFSFNPVGNATCSSLRLFNIKVSTEDTTRIAHTKYDCQDRNITMEIASEWDNVIWKNNLNSTTASGQSLVHNLQVPITFKAYASNSYGCQLKEEFNLKLSKPDLQVGGTHYQIIKGTSVSLSASGGNFYLWTPGATLDDNQIANPTATPEETTEYKVTAYDSLGCEVNATILVEVFEEAFIPTLFTPNGDGRNDNLKIYGLTQANGFRFTIYNREGNKLFDTSSVDEATQSGWSGAVNGHIQPPGTYYWKVEGSMPKGDLLLSGKKSGVFLLVR